MLPPGSGQPDPYERIAALYDLEHDPVHDDAELYAAIADQIDGPVLEMGCGSGRLLVPLAKAGHDVTGLDRSDRMLERAQDRTRLSTTRGTITLHRGGMASDSPVPGEPFGLVLFSLNALMHLESPEEQLDALVAARGRIAPHGQVIVDALNPTPQYLIDLGRGPILEWSANLADGSTVDKWSVRVIDPVEQTIDTTLWYDQVSAEGQLARHHTRFTLRYVHANELVLMLERAGFTDVRLFGSMELEPLTENSERILAIAGST